LWPRVSDWIAASAKSSRRSRNRLSLATKLLAYGSPELSDFPVRRWQLAQIEVKTAAESLRCGDKNTSEPFVVCFSGTSRWQAKQSSEVAANVCLLDSTPVAWQPAQRLPNVFASH